LRHLPTERCRAEHEDEDHKVSHKNLRT
jgi:hypothetical protein